MSDPRSNWRELAEMLGLPADEPPQAPTPTPAPPARMETSPEPLAQQLDEEWAPPVPEQASDLSSTVHFEEVDSIEEDADASESTSELTVIVDGPAGGSNPSADGESSEGDKPRRRRRGRRSRRRGRGDEAETAAATTEVGEHGAATEEASVEQESPEEDERGDRRGRRRRRPAPAEEASQNGADDADTLVAEYDAGDDDFSQDAWADWNVPSWQELIDGLHRPDRDR